MPDYQEQRLIAMDAEGRAERALARDVTATREIALELLEVAIRAWLDTQAVATSEREKTFAFRHLNELRAKHNAALTPIALVGSQALNRVERRVVLRWMRRKLAIGQNPIIVEWLQEEQNNIYEAMQ